MDNSLDVPREVALNVDSPTFGGDGISIDANNGLYLEAPSEYTGNRLSSYSQHIQLSLEPFVSGNMVESTLSYGILLEGNGVTIGANYNRTDSGFSVQLQESAGWVNIDSLASLNVQQFKTILSSLSRLLVSVSFSTDVILFSIDMGAAVPLSQLPNTSNLEEVTSVQECECPANYTGLSCQLCSPGFTRTSSGSCELCQCNGLSFDCDPETGACLNCSGSSTGPSCEVCRSGTYGDPAAGVDCLPCPCPLTSTAGQFTDECILLATGEILCINCPLGHTG